MKMRVTSVVVLVTLLTATALHAAPRKEKFTTSQRYLIIETLADDLIHVETATGAGPDVAKSLYTSPMVLKTNYTGPTSYSKSGNTIETAELKAEVDPASLCVTVTDKARKKPLTSICQADLESDWKGLNISKGQVKAVYGLGQQFKDPGVADGDWLQHKVREEQPGGQAQAHGNGFMPYYGGMVGNIQFPIMYALGDNNLNYALFLDNVYKQRWDFSGDPWKARMWGDQIRYYVMTGPDLPDLRKDYLQLTGTPPVPPRKALGMWMSEFGYKNWTQIDNLLTGLRRDDFPVDGFILDLFWFGGIKANSPDSNMGRLNWDESQNDGNDYFFPDPAAKLAAYKKDNVGIITIEESYVSRNTDTFRDMNKAGHFLAYQRTNGVCDSSSQQPIFLNEWFGQSAMIDWSNPQAGQWIHENRRFPNMVEKGVTAHWTDLGEPEKYDPAACYHGVEITAAGPKNQHGDIHNLYAFLWNKSIYDNYAVDNGKNNQRPFILTRSGAPGSQRFGVGTWYGDEASNTESLGAHMNAQMHMSFSGIDHISSDVGGFRREALPYNQNHSGNLQYQNELYTQWFANGSWLESPIKPHTDNSFQTRIHYETAPDLVGDVRSNRANIRQRYELTPYYYSLAYRAFLYGEPVIPAVVFYYQNDPNVRTMGHEKLIGKDLLVGVVAKYGEYARNIYLPKGTWVNYNTRDWFKSNGEWVKDFPEYVDGVFRLPAFARAGAILPMMYVDGQTKDVFGHRKDGSVRDELIVQAYADDKPSTFTLYEDDGGTIAFTPDKRPLYNTRTTTISQQKTGNRVTLTIDQARGSFPGSASSRNNVIRLVVDGAGASGVKLNGKSLAKINSAADFDKAKSGWFNAERNLVLVKSGPMAVTAKKSFDVSLTPIRPAATANLVCDNGWTTTGEDIYAVGNVTALGNWDPAKGVKLSPSIYWEYISNPPPGHNGPGPSTPKWTGVVRELPSSATVEWKCVKRTGSGQWQYMPGSNLKITTPKSGFAGTSVGAF